nr:TetR/AcrR family transcriptional regulator [Thiocystis violacea]
MDAAVQLLEEEGPDRLTTRAVAGRIGYTVGSLYFLFRNRDDLVLQVNGRTLDELRAAIELALVECTDTRLALLAMGRAYLGFAARHPARWRLIFEHGLPAETALPATLVGKIDGFFSLVAGYLARLVPGLDSREARRSAQALWSGVHGVTVLAITGKLEVGGDAAAESLAEDLIDYYLDGLTAARASAVGPADPASLRE